MPDDVHLFLLIHGLWGKPEHLVQVRSELEAAWAGASGCPDDINVKDGKGDRDSTPPNVDSGANSPYLSNASLPSVPVTSSPHSLVAPLSPTSEEELVVVVAKGMTAKLTYDGVDVCASRVAWEVDQHIAALETTGKRVTKFSVLGYSLGGLVARYLVGLLEARTPSFFDTHAPVSFTTMATPHLGMTRYNTFLSWALMGLGAHLLSRTGEQVYVADKYSERDPRPLLEIMADPKHVFHQALTRFPSVLVYANVVNDATVPFPSAAIEADDPFVQWCERGIEVDANDTALVSDWHFPPLAKGNKGPPKGWHLGVLPPTLRFRWPLNYIILALFPILFPLLFILILIRFSLDTVRSRKRLQKLVRAEAQASQSQVQGGRTGLESPPSPVSPASAHIPSPHGLSIDRLREAIRAVERNIEQDLIQAAEYEIGHTEGGEHFDHHHEHAHMTGKAKSAADSATGVRRRHVRPAGVPLKSGKLDDASDSSSTDSTTLLVPEPTIRVSLTESQRRMVLWLNALNPTKFLAWYPDVPNAHAVIIVRDPVRFAAHERGRGVIRHWASMVTKAAAAH